MTELTTRRVLPTAPPEGTPPEMAAFFDPSRHDLRLAALLGDTTGLIRRIFDRRMKVTGLTRAQLKVILGLSLSDGVSQTELAETTELERAPLGRLLDRMEAGGWIQRRDDPHDRRIRRVYRTERLMAVFPVMAGTAEGLMAEALKDVAPADLEIMVAALNRIKATLMGLDEDGRG